MCVHVASCRPNAADVKQYAAMKRRGLEGGGVGSWQIRWRAWKEHRNNSSGLEEQVKVTKTTLYCRSYRVAETARSALGLLLCWSLGIYSGQRQLGFGEGRSI
jgi:hypothetical protein